ncbi:galactose mutarotase-like domain-containing protein [Spinellus fusiger]|nr:galactose mutarotase-like domain-containing protein [Spinellus fusiger]
MNTNYTLRYPQIPSVHTTPKATRQVVLDRCTKFMCGNVNGDDMNLFSQLYKAHTSSEDYISISVHSVPDLKRISFSEAIRQSFKPTRVGEWFGPSWSTHWFRLILHIPHGFAGEEVQLIWNADTESMLWNMEGTPLQGFTGGEGSTVRREFILTPEAKGGEVFQYYIEMTCHGIISTSPYGPNPSDASKFFCLTELGLAVPNTVAWDLFYNYQVIFGMAKDLEETSVRAVQALSTVNQIVNSFRPGDEAALLACLDLSEKFLMAKNGDSQHKVHSMGHCHIDTAWLWTFEETIRKAARSWSTQVDLLDRYPDYKFMVPQAQHYEWIRTHYPSLWERVLKKNADGQLLHTGGTWVEMDTNMPSGESLSRQLLLGQRFFDEHLGVRCRVLWISASFGFCAQLPQLIKLADMKYFYTPKISWGNMNEFPMTTFWWIGLDGTKVLAHVSPTKTHAAQCTPGELIDCVKNNYNKEQSNASMLVFGNSNGGGGPSAGMIERLHRMGNVDGLPKVEMSAPLIFFEKAERTVNSLSTWKGEIYCEAHRGIYTTHALCKKMNRTCEVLLHDVEILASLAHMMNPEVYSYPKDILDIYWRMVCLCQFHGIMSGSSIESVYEDCLRMYLEVETGGKKMRDDLVEKLMNLSPLSATTFDIKALAVFNTLPWSRCEVIDVSLCEGLPALKQYSALARKGYTLVRDVPPLGAKGYYLDESPMYEPVQVITDRDHTTVIENQYILVTFDSYGQMISLYDKEEERELIKKGEKGNVFQMYEDIPLSWDACDAESYHLDKGRVVEEGSVQIIEKGPLRAALLIEKYLSPTSCLRQVVVVTAISRRIDFETEVDWDERRQFLKVEFSWDLLADTVYYDTPYGVLQRPTHFNTAWDSAKFEVAAQKFADISEYGYGIALLNDCKYGYAAHHSTIRLSLIRSPKSPNPSCDIGHHVFSYAIYPHKGHFLQSTVVRESHNFNAPLLKRVIPKSKVPTIANTIPQISIEGAPNVVLDTIKKAEDSDDIILRLYEAYGGHAKAQLVSSLPIQSLHICNLLEDKLESIETTLPSKTTAKTIGSIGGVFQEGLFERKKHILAYEGVIGIPLTFKPFQILTLIVSFQK